MTTLTQESVRAQGWQGGAAAEPYYALAHWLRPAGELQAITPKTVGLTSCSRGTGVSTVAWNLAAVTASTRQRPVLLLDLSRAHLPIAVVEDWAESPRLIDGAARASDRFGRVTPTQCSNLSLLRIRGSEDESADCQLGVGELLASLEQEFDFIVVDLPTTESSVCFATAGLLNGILLIMEAERTHCEAASRAKAVLDQARANILGVILNKHACHLPRWLETRL